VAIADAILTLITNRDRATEMGSAGYERARDLFGWEKFVTSLEAVYARVIEEREREFGAVYRTAA
jgi:starch synthase